MSKPIKYWVVKRPSKQTDGAMKDVAHFTKDTEAKLFAESSYFTNSYGSVGSVECVSFNIFDTAVEAEANSLEKLRESGLAKLSDKEKRALGLLDVNPLV